MQLSYFPLKLHFQGLLVFLKIEMINVRMSLFSSKTFLDTKDQSGT